MKNRYTLFVSLLMLIVMLFSGIVCVFADNETAVTNPVQQETTAPTDATVSDTTSTQSTETDTTPSDTVSPTETTSLTESTETTVTETRPTEYDPNNAPSTYTPYSPNEGLIEASSYSGTAANWDEDIDPSDVLSLNGDSVAGIKDFNQIKENTSQEDEKSYTLIIIGAVLIGLSIVGFIFIPVSYLIGKDKKKIK